MIVPVPFRNATRRLLRRNEPPPAIPSILPGPGNLFDVVARAQAGRGDDHRDRAADFRTVFFGSESGKRVLCDILAWSHLFASTFVPGDAHATHWREGGRDVGLRILAALAPDSGAASADRADDGADAPDTGGSR